MVQNLYSQSSKKKKKKIKGLVQKCSNRGLGPSFLPKNRPSTIAIFKVGPCALQCKRSIPRKRPAMDSDFLTGNIQIMTP